MTNTLETGILIIHEFTHKTSMVKQMRRILTVILCFWLVMGCLMPAYATTNNISNGCLGPDAGKPLLGQAALIQNATSAIMYETTSGTLMYGFAQDMRVSPSSCVKLMTAMLAIEEGELDARVTVTRSALNAVSIGAVTTKLQVGEELSLRDLLNCMLVGSGNDAAAVIAEHIGGSQTAFVEKMNTRAVQLGCTDTNFTNAHGLHSEEQYTTARDMLKIILAAMEYDVFRELFGTTAYTVPATNLYDERKLSTGNYLLINDGEHIYYDERVTGGRTGIAQDGSRCVAASAKKGNMELITLVFGASSKYAADGYTIEVQGGFQETTQLLDLAFDGYQVCQILYENQMLAQREVRNGDNALTLCATGSAFAVLPESLLLSQIEYRIQDSGKTYTAPIENGSLQTTVEVWFGSFCVGQGEIAAGNAVAVASSKLGEKPTKSPPNLRPLGIVLLMIAVLPVAALVTLRILNTVRARRADTNRGNKR